MTDSSQGEAGERGHGGGLLARFRELFTKKTNKLSGQFFRYIWVGGITTVIDFLVLNLFLLIFTGAGFIESFTDYVGGFIPGTTSSDVLNFLGATLGYSFGIVANYYLCIWWIFQSNPEKRKYEFIGSMIIGLVGMGLNALIIVYGAKWLPGLDFLKSFSWYKSFSEFIPNYYVNMSKVIATVIVLAWNFLARKYFIFTPPKTAD